MGKQTPDSAQKGPGLSTPKSAHSNKVSAPVKGAALPQPMAKKGGRN